MNYVEEVACYPEYYPETSLKTYAPRWYYKKPVKRDRYSTKVWFSKSEDHLSFFLPYIEKMISELKEEKISISEYNLITMVPRHEIDSYSVTIQKICENLSDKFKISFEKIIVRTHNKSQSHGRNSTFDERYLEEHESMELIRELKPTENKIIILDDIRTTGITFLEINELFDKQKEIQILPLCLGINSSTDQEKKGELNE